MDKKLLFKYVKQFSLKSKSQNIDIIQLKKFVESAVISSGKGKDFINNIDSVLEELEADGKVVLDKYKNGEITNLKFLGYVIDRLEDTYLDMNTNFSIPFPEPADFPESLDPTLVKVIDVKSELVALLQKEIEVVKPVIQLDFNNFEHSILVFPRMLDEELIEHSVNKIKAYLEKEQNFDYVRSKLNTSMSNEQSAVGMTLTGILNRPTEVVTRIKDPTSFSFKFWSQLANLIVKDYAQRKSMNAGDLVYAQAAILLGYYNMYYKSIAQKESDREETYKILLEQFKRPPYAYSLSEIFNFTDKNGNNLAKKVGKDVFEEDIRKLLSEKGSNNIPKIISIKDRDTIEYYIGSEVISKYISKNIVDYGLIINKYIVNEWQLALEHLEEDDSMNDEKAFEEMLHKKFASDKPVLCSLINYRLLNLLLENGVVKGLEKEFLESLISKRTSSIKSYSEIFNLDRKKLLQEAKLLVPLWKSNKFLKGFVMFLVGLLGGKKGKKKVKKKAQENNQKAPPKDEFQKVTENTYKDTLRNLKSEIVGDNEDINVVMNDYIKKWNPLFEEVAKQNLVEDVNSLIRDYIRKMKRSLISNPPDRARVENMAEKLVINDVFEKISDKYSLQRYIELYIISVLESIKLFK